MKHKLSLIVILSLLLQPLACVLPSINTPQPSNPDIPNPDQPTVTPLGQDSPTQTVVVMTGDPNYAQMAFFPDRSILVEKTSVDGAGNIQDLTGAIFIAPNNETIDLTIENGLPVRAVAQGYLVEFSNFTGSRVDVSVTAPDGTRTVTPDVPFDMNKIEAVSAHPAAGQMALVGWNASPRLADDIDWVLFASTALGAFSCAATIGSGGTLTVLFGVGCGIFLYTTYMRATGQDAPVLVQGAGLGVSAINCGTGLGAQNPIAISTCSKLVVDVADKVQSATADTTANLAPQNPPAGALSGETTLYIPTLNREYYGSVNDTGPYDTLFVGAYATGDWPHCSGSITLIEAISYDGSRLLYSEPFDSSSAFTQIGDTVYISGGKAVFDNFYRDGGAQFVYHNIPPISEPFILNVHGQINDWENNCGIFAGVGKQDVIQGGHDGDYPAIFFGWFGGGCPVSGPFIQSPNITNFESDGCSFTANGAGWVDAGTELQALLYVK